LQSNSSTSGKGKKEKKGRERREVRWSYTIIKNRIIENNGHMIPFWAICNCRAQNGRKKEKEGGERGGIKKARQLPEDGTPFSRESMRSIEERV
jgi:hypothetical protein